MKLFRPQRALWTVWPLLCSLHSLGDAAKIRVDQTVIHTEEDNEPQCGALTKDGGISPNVNDFTSKKRMEAAGWSWSKYTEHSWKPKTYSKNVPPGSYWGFVSGGPVMELSLTLKGKGTLLITFGNQCCGNTQVKLNGKSLAKAYAKEISHYKEIHFNDGDTLTFGEYNTAVLIISEVHFVCGAHVEKFANLDCEGSNVNDFSSIDAMNVAGWRFKGFNEKKYRFKPGGQFGKGVPPGSYWGFKGHNPALEAFLTLRGQGHFFLSFGNAWKGGKVKVFKNNELQATAGPKSYHQITRSFVDGDELKLGEYNTAILVIAKLWISCEERIEAKCGARTPLGLTTNNVNNFQSRRTMEMAGWTFKNWQDADFKHKNYKKGVPGGSYWGFHGGDKALEMSLILKGSGRIALWYGKQIKHGSVEVMINDKRQDQIKKGKKVLNKYLELSFKDGDVLKIGEYATSVTILTKVVFDCAPEIPAPSSQCTAEKNLNNFGSVKKMKANGWVFNAKKLNFKNKRYGTGVPAGSFWGFRGGKPALEMSTTLKGSGKLLVVYGNQHNGGVVKVFLNDEQIGIAGRRKLYQYVETPFKDGDVLKLGEYNTAVMVVTRVLIDCALSSAPSGKAWCRGTLSGTAEKGGCNDKLENCANHYISTSTEGLYLQCGPSGLNCLAIGPACEPVPTL